MLSALVQRSATLVASRIFASMSGTAGVGRIDSASARAICEIEDAHKAACDAGVSSYADPATGYKVITSQAHEKRGFCCGNACRHCPFGHLDVNPEHRSAESVPKRVMLTQHRKKLRAKLTVGAAWDTFRDHGAGRVVLFWSGGKDSFLTLRALQNMKSQERITLLTTFDGKTGNIPFQDTKISDVITQARHEGVDILTVPLGGSDTGPYPEPYAVTLKSALKPLKVKRLAFGDLHLQELRSWREDTFSGTYSCEFPLFEIPYKELLSRLWEEDGVSIRVCSVSPEFRGVAGFAVGDVYCEAFVKGLPGGIDLMGENGEFHTHVYHASDGSDTVSEDRDDDDDDGDLESESESDTCSAGGV